MSAMPELPFDENGELHEPDGRVYKLVDNRTAYQKVRDELRDHLDDAVEVLNRNEPVSEEDMEYMRGLCDYLTHAQRLGDTTADQERIIWLSDRIDTLSLQRRLLYDAVMDPDRNEKQHALSAEFDELLTEYVELRALVRIARAEYPDKD